MIVFLSYAKEDADIVADFYTFLTKAGYQPWMDKYNILPGQNWKFEIQSAIATCDAAILFLSHRSVSKTGYVQAELAEFLEQSKLRPESAIYLIPARLDDCNIPRSLSGLQYVNLFDGSGRQRILDALVLTGRQQSRVRQVGEVRGGFTVLTKVVEETWAGLPGYSVNLKYPELHGGSPRTCETLNFVFRAEYLSRLDSVRSIRLEQNHCLFANSSPEFHTSKEVMEYTIKFLSPAALSVLFNIIGYRAGAAHGYAKYNTKNFLLQPEPAQQLGLHHFFKDSTWIEILGEAAKEALRNKAWERNKITFNEQELQEGMRLEPWNNLEFTFDENELTLYFQECQIGPYAIGRWEVTLPFDNLRQILRPDWLDGLIRVPLGT